MCRRGVINILTGLKPELVPILAGHMDVNALDTWGVPREMREQVEVSAMESVKRVARPPRDGDDRFDWLDDRRAQRPGVDHALPGDEDGLAPDRGLAPPRATSRRDT